MAAPPRRRNLGELSLPELKQLLGEKEIERQSMLLRIIETEGYVADLEQQLGVNQPGKPALEVLDGGQTPPADTTPETSA